MAISKKFFNTLIIALLTRKVTAISPMYESRY